MTDQPQPAGRRWRAPAVVLVAILAIVLVLTGGVALVTGGLPAPSGTGSPTEPPTQPVASASPGETDAQGFPLEALGMPVATVGGAMALIDAGALDGRVVAVAGFWLPMVLAGCSAPMRFMAPLEGYCHWQTFASRGFEAVTCRPTTNGGTECHGNQPPAGTQVMSPLTVDAWVEGIQRLITAAQDPLWRTTGTPAILIGHAGDPRMWHCPAETRSECERQFVVDRVAWMAGEWIDLTGPPNDGAAAMVVQEAAAAAHVDGELVSAFVVPAGEVATVDPRFQPVGDKSIWILRSLRPGQTDMSDPTRAVDVALVDNGSGELIASNKLEMGDSYQPGRLLVQATEPGECCPGFDVYPFYQVETKDGTEVWQSQLGGPESGTPDNTRTRFYAGLAAVLVPGEYVVRAWNATLARDGSSGPPQDECSTPITVQALVDARVEAQFPAVGSCSFVSPTFGDNVF